jgi:hypothetical protein
MILPNKKVLEKGNCNTACYHKVDYNSVAELELEPQGAA